jgi:GYF domain 2
MDYFISRDGQKYGPYTLADLQRYVASGEVSLTDLASSEGMTEPVSVAQIVGNIAVPRASTIAEPLTATDIYPDPPNLHWGLVLLFVVLTCGLFSMVWDIIQGAWMKRIEPASKSIYYYGAAAVALMGIFFGSFFHGLNQADVNITPIFQITYYVLLLVGRFSLRSSMEEHFNGPEPMGLSLSGVMTFFFGGIYFQYHINDIVRRKAADRLYAATR